MRDYLKGWKETTDEMIPPIEKRRFREKVIIRKPVDPIRPKTESGVDEEGTVYILNHSGKEDDSTTILGSDAMKKLFLTRLRTGEKIEMTSTPFVVGKGRDSDYLIIGNPTISRRHAIIEKTGEEFFVEDLQSSNHTFIDGEQLEGRYKLTDQMIIQLSDEKFKVEIKV